MNVGWYSKWIGRGTKKYYYCRMPNAVAVSNKADSDWYGHSTKQRIEDKIQVARQMREGGWYTEYYEIKQGKQRPLVGYIELY